MSANGVSPSFRDSTQGKGKGQQPIRSHEDFPWNPMKRLPLCCALGKMGSFSPKYPLGLSVSIKEREWDDGCISIVSRV